MKETQHIEWKQSWRDDYLRWICGFANAQGGTLMIGKDDKGKVVGVDNADKLLVDIPNKVRDILGIVVVVALHHNEAGHDWLEILVDAYPSPISYKGEYHLRSGSTKQELKGAALDRFLLRKLGRHWDGVPVPHVSLADLDARALARFRQLATRSQRLSMETLQEPDATLIDKLHLKEANYLKRAAVLLFHPDPEQFVTGAFVKIGFFANNADLRYHDEVHGDLFTQVDKTLDLLLSKYLRAMISYEGVQRVETYPVPEVALREAVLNAIAHKDYASGIPVQISVYDDKIMLWNPGQLPSDWTVEQLTEKHSSQPFNPDVANAFFRAGLIESWGRGIERVFNACLQAGAPEPEWRYESTGLWVVFHQRETIGVAAAGSMAVEVAGSMTVEMAVKIPDRILQLLLADPHMTLADVAGRVGKSLRTIERISNQLVKDRRLLRVGPRKGGHWTVLVRQNSQNS
jgi:ATP-dependent DNA helicase RecG